MQVRYVGESSFDIALETPIFYFAFVRDQPFFYA